MDKRLTALTTLSARPADDDVIYIVDVSDTTDHSSGTSKKQTVKLFRGTWAKETPSGSHDGSNLIYSLTRSVYPSSGNLFVNRQLYIEGVDYTVTGLSLNQITLTEALPKGFDGSFIFHYQYYS